MLKKTIYKGTFIYCDSLEDLEISEHGNIGVDEQGTITFINHPIHELDAKWSDAHIIDINKNNTSECNFFFPGFIDTHIHASQYPNAGLFGNTLTLLDWLKTYTFPLERRFSCPIFAEKVYSTLLSRQVSNGTTCSAYYTTIHVESTNILSKLCFERGIRAFVGRVCMDRRGFVPDDYRDETVHEALHNTESCLAFIKALDPKGELLCGVITPRFAPACSEDLLKRLGQLAIRDGNEKVLIQTHISENKNEIELVKELFPDKETYTNVYDDYGLLMEKTILAHGIYLSQEERLLIKSRKAKLSHCPCSNTCLGSGAVRVRTWLDEGLDVGLGSDVSGGYSCSILEQCRHALLVSRHVAFENGKDDERAKLSVNEALYLATRGGAKVLGIDNKVGAFKVGMAFDAQFISLEQVQDYGRANDITVNDKMANNSLVDLFGTETWNDKIAKWVYTGDDRNVKAVWIKGKLVHIQAGQKI